MPWINSWICDVPPSFVSAIFTASLTALPSGTQLSGLCHTYSVEVPYSAAVVIRVAPTSVRIRPLRVPESPTMPATSPSIASLRCGRRPIRRNSCASAPHQPNHFARNALNAGVLNVRTAGSSVTVIRNAMPTPYAPMRPISPMASTDANSNEISPIAVVSDVKNTGVPVLPTA